MHGLMMETPLLITEIMRYAEKNHPKAEVVSVSADHPRHRCTYAEVFRRARRLANALAAAGIREGDRVGTLAWNDHRHLELYYAVSCMGAVLHTINPRLFPEQVEFIINHAEDRLLFVDPTLLPLYAQLAGKLPTVRQTIVMTSDSALPADIAAKLESYEAFIAGQPDSYDWPVLDERAAAALCYTSGTTGNPKGVLFSHRSTLLHAYAGCLPDVLNLSRRESVLAVVPMFHANAWGLPYACAITGAKLVFPGPKMGDPATLTALIEEESVTHAAGVPTVWTGLLNYLEQTGKRLPTLKRTLVGGSAVPLKMIREFEEKHGIVVQQGWGMTEMSPIGTVNSYIPDDASAGEDTCRKRTLQGRAVFGVDMKIVDEQNRELPWDGVATGELKVRGPWVCRGYFRVDERRRRHRRRRIPAYHGPRQGRHQVGRRVDQLGRHGKLRLRSPGCAHGRRHRRAPPEMGRAAAVDRRAEAGTHASPRLGARAHRSALRQVAAARRRRARREHPAHRHRQDRQEAAEGRILRPPDAGGQPLTAARGLMCSAQAIEASRERRPEQTRLETAVPAPVAD
jgi:fatty-acyl-CoA synthase